MKKIMVDDEKIKLSYSIIKNKDNILEFIIQTNKKCKLYYDGSKEPVITDVIVKTSIDESEVETIKYIMQSRKNALTYFSHDSSLYKDVAQLRASTEKEIPFKE